MNNCEVSVLVLQYNPSFEAVKKTILSIIRQQNIEFEIVVADDGSKEDHFEKLKELFAQYSFSNYTLVKNQQNGGTVKNVLSGLKKCTGRYTKCISPGDCLYNPNVLETACARMKETGAGLLFGKMAFYNADKGIKIFKERRPFKPEVYVEGDLLKIRKHLLIYQDNISGASAFMKTDLFTQMMEYASGRIVFQEDVTFSMFTFMNEPLVYLDAYVVWYEYGGGVSTSGEDKWVARLQKDTLSYYKILRELYPKETYVKRAHLFQTLELKKGIFWKTIKTVLFFDRFLFRRNLDMKESDFVLPEIKFLEEIINESGR